VDTLTLGLDAWPGWAAALGSGLLIGLERERRKGQGPDREAAGIRSFTLAAGLGALASTLPVAQPALVVLGGVLVAALAVAAYWRSRAADPGLTTELALFTTYLIGVLSLQVPAWGAAAGVLLAGLLAARSQMHRVATQWLSEAELHDALLLAALALVALPLMPAEPVAWLGGVPPRRLAGLVVLILLLQAAGHVALRLFGARAGLVLAGLCSGFVSSTATIASLGSRVRHADVPLAPAAAGASASAIATWLQALILLGALAPGLVQALWPLAVAGAATAAAATWLLARQAGPARQAHRPGPPAAEATPPDPGPASALRLREALLVSVLLTAMTAGVGQAEQWAGASGVLLGTGLAALADAHAALAAVGALVGSQRLPEAVGVMAVLIAISVNTASRSLVGYVSGGAAYGSRVTLALWASTGAAWATGWGLSLT
jgi:uncharacterized membrane protein (DUF4010 family)